MTNLLNFVLPIISTAILVYIIHLYQDQPILLRIAIGLQQLYIFLGLILRPLILYIKQPVPKYGDSFIDPIMLQSDADLTITLRSMNEIITLGLLVYAVATRLYLQRKRFRSHAETNIGIDHITVYPALLITFLATYLTYSGIEFLPLIWLSQTTLPLVGLVFVFSNLSKMNQRTFVLVSLSLFTYCFLLSLIQVSKTPISAWFVFFPIAYLKRRTINRGKMEQRKSSLRNFTFFILLSFLYISVFSYIQGLKQQEDTRQLVKAIGQTYFPNFPEIYIFLARFDLFRSLSEAFRIGIGGWYDHSEYLYLGLNAFIWQLNSNKLTIGQLWATNVSSNFNSYSLGTNVSLSQSYIAEGWLLGGYKGVVIISFLYAIYTVTVLKFSGKSLFLRLTLLSLLSSNYLFESGLLGNAGGISQGIKVSILGYLLVEPFRTLQKKGKIDLSKYD